MHVVINYILPGAFTPWQMSRIKQEFGNDKRVRIFNNLDDIAEFSQNRTCLFCVLIILNFARTGLEEAILSESSHILYSSATEIKPNRGVAEVKCSAIKLTLRTLCNGSFDTRH